MFDWQIVLNESSQEEVGVRDVRIMPNLNSSYLPMMPDGSVTLVDNVCHQSEELHLDNCPQDDSKEGLEVPLVAVLQWSTAKMPFTNYINTHTGMWPPVPQ
ncbi:unnamed protein product [Gadus morhua 'NCC']